MAEDQEFFQKKNKIHLYKNYFRTEQKMTNEQAGELLKLILHFVNTGELLGSEDPRVDTAFDFIGERLEFDTRNYVETCQKNSENGKLGGRPKKEPSSEEDEDTPKKANKVEKPKKQKKPTGFSEKPKKPDIDTDTETGTETDTETETDADTEENQNYYYCSGKGAGAEAMEETMEETSEAYIHYGREQYLTTSAEVEKMHALADELMHSYRSKKASPDDREKVFGYVHTIGVTDNGEHYGIYSQEKADLLRHAFEQASLRSDISWQYISRIYSNYDKNSVTNVEEAIAYEMAWNRGEVTA